MGELKRYDEVWVRAQVAEAPSEHSFDALIKPYGRPTALEGNSWVSPENIARDVQVPQLHRITGMLVDALREEGIDSETVNRLKNRIIFGNPDGLH